jgi:UDP-glucose:glycoprotein glucosyltransferase
MFWMNGMHIPRENVEAFNLLSLMRRERNLIFSLRKLGLSSNEAVMFLSHEKIAEKIEVGTTNRFDIRDDVEGGDVIIWLNDLEKDTRYKSWPLEIRNVFARRAWLMVDVETFVSGPIAYDSKEYTSCGIYVGSFPKGRS